MQSSVVGERELGVGEGCSNEEAQAHYIHMSIQCMDNATCYCTGLGIAVGLTGTERPSKPR